MKLLHPIQLSEKKTVTEIVFRDYTCAADYLAFDNHGGVAQNIALIASLTGTDESLVKRLRGADYRRAQQIADDMIAADGTEAADPEKKSLES